MKEEIFNPILDTFENEDIKQFMIEKCMPTIPEYFWEVPASSTGKYHPAYSVTVPLGLAKHTVALVRLLNHMLNIESIGSQFSSRERDLLRIAGLMHDTRKSGTQTEFERSKWTKFDHPIQAANVISKLKGLPENEIGFITSAIMSHMGQWNTDKRSPKVTLPKPQSKAQIILHLADYLASRKDIELLFDGVPEGEILQPETKEKPKRISIDDIDPYDFEIRFGKYEGLTWPEIEKENPGYIEWGKDKEGFAFDVLRKYLKEKTA